MKGNVTFRRKVMYFVAMAVLLIPLSYISHPSARDNEGRLSEGGTLSQMRRRYGLSQAELGEIDPASESMKLATLGMRGIAANILWEKANYDKKTENWDSLKATLNQITKLQPNFISVWQHQAWNLSYNVSVEFDDYRQRYHWVKKGIDYLIEGTQYNRDEPRLLWDIGWFFGHKIGRSDEKKQFRRMFSADTDFHQRLPINFDETAGPDGLPDNWLVSRQWYLKAQQVVDTQGVPIKGKSPLVFHSHPPMAQINYADAIEEEGVLDEKAQYAWMKAGQLWRKYGDREIPTSFGFDIRLNDAELTEEKIAELTSQLDRLAGSRGRLIAEQRDTLTPAEKAVLDVDESQRTPEQQELAYTAQQKLQVTHQQVADAAPADQRTEAHRLADKISKAQALLSAIKRYRDIVNFEYWRTRCDAEQQDAAIDARKFVYEADKAYEAANLEGAREKYEKSWQQWAIIFAQHPSMMDDAASQDLMEAVNRYRDLLGQLDEEFPPPGFPLGDLVAIHDKDFRAAQSDAVPPPQKSPSTASQDDAVQGEPTDTPPEGTSPNADSTEPRAANEPAK